MAEKKVVTAQEATEKEVKVRALKPLRGKGGKRVEIGGTTEVPESTAKILVNKQAAELVKE